MTGGAWKTVALWVSVGVNLFIIGALVGGAAAGVRVAAGPEPVSADRTGHAARAMFTREFSPRDYVAALPPDERRRVMRILARSARDAGPMIQDARRARAAALDAARAPEFDPDAARAAFEAALAAETALKARGYETVLAMLEATPDELRVEAVTTAQQQRPGERAGPWRERRLRRSDGPAPPAGGPPREDD